MRHQNTLEVLGRLLAATRDGKITWRDDLNDWRTTNIGDADNNTVSYRFRHIEAPPQIGADPYILELTMPFLNAEFTIGTEGYELLFQIHVASTGSEHGDGSVALDLLDRIGL